MLISPFTKNAPNIHEDKSDGASPPRVPTARMIATGPEAAKMNATRPLTTYTPPKSARTRRKAGGVKIGLLDLTSELGGLADVAGRREFEQPRLLGLRQREAADESAHRFAVNALAARERLEPLVGIGKAIAAHHRLHGFAEHFPVGLQVLEHSRGIRLELAQALEAGLVGEQAVAERDADVPQHHRIRKVALPARHGQLLGKMPKQRVRDPEVALGVLEIDRIDLVRHGRGADFPRFRLLFEITQRDVAPQVAVEIEQHG